MEDGSYDHGKVNGYTSKTPMEPGQSDADSVLTIGERMLIFKSSVYTDSARQIQYIPMSSVSYAEVRNAKNAKYIGLAIGLLFDIIAISSMDMNFDFSPAIANAFSEAGK
jgi:hypothetical protein